MMVTAAFAASRRLFVVETRPIQRQSLQSLHIAFCYTTQQNPVRNRSFGLDHDTYAHHHHQQQYQLRSFSSHQQRRHNRKRLRMRDKAAEDLKQQQLDEKPKHVKPWWRYITIWPDPHGYDPEFEKRQRFPRPTSLAHLREAWDLTVKDYRSTFEGWLLPEPEEIGATHGAKETSISEQVEAHRKQIQSNVAKNVKFLKVEGSEALQEVQKRTGIYTLQHLKEWTALQLQLATECVQEFMVGYREGRDDEVEKMMNEYFQGMWEDEEAKSADGEPKKRRRNPKRRIRTAD